MSRLFMDQLKTKSVAVDSGTASSGQGLSRMKMEAEVKDAITSRKVQKADREKLRRDRLNEQFFELGNTLDPDRPKNDKATILTDTIQMLKDLTTEVNRLKAEYAALSEESRELMQEKNELREEKASLKSDVESLNAQYQQRLRTMVPWGPVDPSVVMGPTYSYPIPLAIPSGPIRMHPPVQPYRFFGSQNRVAVHNPCSTFMPCSISANAVIEQPSTQYASPSSVTGTKDSKSKSLSRHRKSNGKDTDDDSNDVATDLELRVPGSSGERDTSPEGKKERSMTTGSSSNRYSSSQGFQDSTSSSVDDTSKPNR